MKIDIQTIKMIRSLMQDPRWLAMETAFDIYMKENFQDASVKRVNEFETIWNVAHTEGGKYHVHSFWKGLETKAMNLND